MLLIHPPSVYDFRRRRLHYGPIGDLIPSTPIFELYPAGFLSLATYLAGKGFKVKILNLAARMLLDSDFNVEEALKRLEARVYGVDLHWLVHAQGALRVAELVKRLHPEGFLLLGGLTSTFFWKTLLENYGFIDAIALGDTTEETVEKLLSRLSKGKPNLEDVDNLAWRREGRVKLNRLRPAPESLDNYAIDYGYLVREFLDSWPSPIPFARFMREPIGLALTVKGCPHNCITCGGSSYTYGRYLLRNRLGFKSPAKIAWEILSLLEYARIPVFVVGDLQLAGLKRLEELSRLLREAKLDSPLIYEFFTPPSLEALKLLRKTSERVRLQISPESHEEAVRAAFGRKYGNRELEAFIMQAYSLDFERLDLYFMVGLPGQTYHSALETPKYFRRLLSEKRLSRFLNAFMAPLAPFIDPGSLVYDRPEAFGYKLHFKSFESHVKALEASRSWSEMLNYETRWMGRAEIVRAAYGAARELLQAKIDYGIIGEEEGLETLETLTKAEKAEVGGLKLRETIPSGDLYPARSLLLSLKPKFYELLATFLLKRGLTLLSERIAKLTS
ncbi:MAG: TIGR04190 family B12-binding domain/radical SAM domain protein [Candidatus Hecatellales archaeon]|nr:MAG: TIGR04190 family B12-binding domain/radical SAM domain protein [Candidatus Hecatellales archaeon]